MVPLMALYPKRDIDDAYPSPWLSRRGRAEAVRTKRWTRAQYERAIECGRSRPPGARIAIADLLPWTAIAPALAPGQRDVA